MDKLKTYYFDTTRTYHSITLSFDIIGIVFVT